MKLFKIALLALFFLPFIAPLPADAATFRSVRIIRVRPPVSQEVQNSFATIVQNASPAVVMVSGYATVPIYSFEVAENAGMTVISQKQVGTSEVRVSSGSAFFIKSDGYLLTNKHVVADSTKKYTINTGTAEIVASVVYRDPDYDLAILKINGTNYPTIDLATSSDIKMGESIVTIGNALGQKLDTVSSGSIAETSTDVTVSEKGASDQRINGLIQTTARLYPGDSGGPLLNAEGKAIGINVATAIGHRISFAIPAAVAKEVLKKAGVTA